MDTEILEKKTPLTNLEDIRIAINALEDFDHAERAKPVPDYDAMYKHRDRVNARIPWFTLMYSEQEQCYILY